MATPDVEALKTQVAALAQQVTELMEVAVKTHLEVQTMRHSLRKCQKRCLVDNPPSRWRVLGRAITGMFKPHQQVQLEAEAQQD